MSANTKLAEALRRAVAGLEWFHDRYPLVVDQSDREFMELANAALAAHDAEQAQASEGVPAASIWVNKANLISAKIAQERGGPFDQHTWSEGRTAYHDTPISAASVEQAAQAVPAGDAVPVAWRYQDARGNFRYRGYRPGFDVSHAILRPVALYAHPPAAPAPEAQAVPALCANCAPAGKCEKRQALCEPGMAPKAAQAVPAVYVSSVEQNSPLMCGLSARDAKGLIALYTHPPAAPAPEAGFLEQIEQSRRNVAAWPQWMRDASHVVSASLPVLAPAPQAQAAGQEPYTSERHFALREAHEIKAEEEFCAARPSFDSAYARALFNAGYVRGFDKGTELAEARAALAQRQPLHITVLIDWLAARYRAAGGKEGITDLSAFCEEVMRWTEATHGIGGATTGEQR